MNEGFGAENFQLHNMIAQRLFFSHNCGSSEQVSIKISSSSFIAAEGKMMKSVMSNKKVPGKLMRV